MKNKENKIRKHPFLDKHTALGAIVLMLWGFFFAEVLFATIVGIIFELVGIPIHFSAVLGAFVLLYIHYRWFRPNYQGSIKGGNLALGFKLAAFMCIYYAFLLIQTFVWGSFQVPGIELVASALMAGTAEEAIFRALPISFMMRNWKDESKIPVVLTISAVCFGLIHGTNILSGAALPITLFQIAGAGLMGVLFAAVYLRCGNILPPMIMHIITDYLCFMDKTQVSDSGIMIAKFAINNYIDLMVCVVLAGIGIYLVRPSKRAEILALWDEKWKRTENESEN